ncbi:MAG: peroxiredoxin [Ktedonobacterales bacterium]
MAEQVHLRVGDLAPDFSLQDEHGKLVHLADLRGKRVVVYFYPMDDTHGCTIQACAFRDAYPQIEERNAVVLGISADGAESHRAFQTKYDLPFTLLIDADYAIARAYGAWNYEKDRMQRSHFVVDEQGHLTDVHVGVKADESAQFALQALGPREG